MSRVGELLWDGANELDAVAAATRELVEVRGRLVAAGLLAPLEDSTLPPDGRLALWRPPPQLAPTARPGQLELWQRAGLSLVKAAGDRRVRELLQRLGVRVFAMGHDAVLCPLRSLLFLAAEQLRWPRAQQLGITMLPERRQLVER